MRFAWDRGKSDTNLRDRGFDFTFAALIFDGPTVEVEDRRRDYGETRIVAIGLADGLHLTVVYTDRAVRGRLTRRIVSARRSNRRETKIYDEAAGHS